MLCIDLNKMKLFGKQLKVFLWIFATFYFISSAALHEVDSTENQDYHWENANKEEKHIDKGQTHNCECEGAAQGKNKPVHKDKEHFSEFINAKWQKK